MNVIQLMTGDDCGSKAHERKICLSPCEYLDSMPKCSDQTCMQRENWKKQEGEQELKPGKNVRKAERN